MKLSPLKIEVLLHCYYCPAPHPRSNAPAVREAINFWVKNECITASQGCINGPLVRDYYVTTARGNAMVDHLCLTPLPMRVEKWVDPRFIVS